MANRIVYSCNSSDMDVSDTDDGLREESLPSLAQVVSATSNLDISDYDSDASFHTADDSPRQHSDELEPGQISDASPITYPDPLEIECQVLETQLQENNNRITSINRQLKTYKEREEQIKIRLLEYQVRNSIARNRRPVRRVSVTPVTTPHSHATAVEETQTDRSRTAPPTRPDMIPGNLPSTSQRVDVESHPMPQQTMVSQNCESHQTTAHHLPTISQPSIQHLGTTTHSSGPEKIANAKTKRRKRQRRRIRLRETSGSDTSTTGQTSSPPLKRSKPSIKDIIKISEGCSGNQRLMQAVIDVPFSARYVHEMEKANASDNDDDDDDDVDSEDDEPVEPTVGNKGKGKRKGKGKANPKYVISEEELALIATDIPPYQPKSHLIPREEHRLIVKSIMSHLKFNPPSLKIMRITLLNLQETAIKQDHQLSCHQEEFAKALIRRILRLIEDYMILPEEVYCRPSRLHPDFGDGPARLPEHYYGNLGTVKHTGPDVSHYELHKAVQYFQKIVTRASIRKIDQLLLKTGRMPQQRILRTCDPTNPDRTSNIPFDMHMRNHKGIQEMYRQMDLEKLEAAAQSVTRKPKETKRQKKKRLLAEEQQAKKQKARSERVKKAGQKPMQLVDEAKIEQGESSQCAATATAGNTALNDPDEFDINQLYDFYVNKVKQEPVDPQAIESLLHNPPVLTSPPPPPAAAAAPATTASLAPPAPTAPTAPPADISLQMYDVSPKVTEVPASTPTITQSNPQPSSTHFHPYKSPLSSLGLTDTPKLNKQPKISTLCSAESSGGVCNVMGCRYTHFSDYS
ncbi:hypothetical protein INT47_012929 [Mucor saturninus]|uniref:Uncharacterized protein n=1 Tax=Mucor saturninus TaxID=64648 RepID=A0A8H7QN62_9FUNG|nr:hypothetical protein INT47_012929 [Mucor saturninus]